MMNFVLKHWHPMAGMDYHIPWPPGSPSPAPLPAPYKTGFLLIGLAPTVFSKPISSHMTDGFAITMEKGTDIGSLIPHIGPPSLTLVAEMLVSASKSHFGASRYLAENKIVACALLVSVNPNLNCGTPAPTPTGFVIAITTHVVEMTLGDVLAGLAAMCADIVLEWLFNKLGGAIGKKITSAIMRRMRPSIWYNTLFRYGEARPDAMFRATEQVLRQWRRTGRIVGPLVNFFLGSPLGATAGTFGVPTPGVAVSDGIGGAAEEAGRALGDWLSPPDPVTDYNAGANAPGVIN